MAHAETNYKHAPVDLARVQDAADGDRAFEKELFQIFLEDTAENLATLEQLLAGGDVDGIRARAHTIKGAAGNVGANHLHELARQIEQEPRPAAAPSIRDIMDAIHVEFRAVNDFLRNHLAQL